MQVTIYKILPFDSSVGTTIKFSWSGNQVFKNRCIIKNNETNETVYDNTIDSFKLEHPIDLTKCTTPLVNGTKYNAFITVFNKDNIESDIQTLGSTFLCLKTPVFQFTNIAEGQVLEFSSYNISLMYQQENGELLDSWSIGIYSQDHSLLSSSGVNYDTTNLSHMFSGFNNHAEYYVRATGQTVNGVDLDTGYIGVSVVYGTYGIFTLLELTNMRKEGAIHVKSNIISATGKVKNEPPVYIDNEYLDLRNNSMSYVEGFLFDGNYSFVSKFYGVKPNQEVITLYANDPDELSCSVIYRVGKFGSDEMSGCFELRAISHGITSVYYSNKLSPLPNETDHLGVVICRSNGYYEIQTTNLGGEV